MLLLTKDTMVNLEKDWVKLVLRFNHCLFWSLINHHTRTANNITKTIIITLKTIFLTAKDDLLYERVVFVWISDVTDVANSQHESWQQPLLQLLFLLLNFPLLVRIYLLNQICTIITIHFISLITRKLFASILILI